VARKFRVVVAATKTRASGTSPVVTLAVT
jgi:hypothetical protein